MYSFEFLRLIFVYTHSDTNLYELFTTKLWYYLKSTVKLMRYQKKKDSDFLFVCNVNVKVLVGIHILIIRRYNSYNSFTNL